MKKKSVITAIAVLVINSVCLWAFDTPFFNGYAGILGDMSLEPSFTTEAFVAGQLDFSGMVLVRGEFYIETENLISDNIFVDSGERNSNFRIEEISSSFKFKTANAAHYVSGFLGNFEPAGSDIYLQRYFGISPINSRFTKSWHGLSATTLYPFYGAGISYSVKFDAPLSFSYKFYVNKMEDEDDNYCNVFNSDFRLSGVFPSFIFDASAGFGLPASSKSDDGSDVVLMVRTIVFNAGFTMLAGTRSTNSLFAQAGFSNFTWIPGADSSAGYNRLKFENLYVYLEPRFVFPKFQLNFALFNLPGEGIGDKVFLRNMYGKSVYVVRKDNNGIDSVELANVTGFNVCSITDLLYIGNTNITFGIHGTFAFHNPLSIVDSSDELGATFAALFGDLQQLGSYILTQSDFAITPFAELPCFGGTANAAMSINVMKIISSVKVGGDLKDEWKSAIKANLGFSMKI